MRRGWSLLVCGILWLGMAGTLLADGAMLNGISPRSIGRGGTNIAFSDNGGVLFDNPAAAVNVQGDGLMDLGVDLLQSDYRYSNPRNLMASDSGLTPLPQISIIKKTADGQWAYGFGVFVPSGFSELFHLNGPASFPGDQRYRSFGLQGKILPAVAYRVNDRLSVGATLGMGISHIELEGPYCLQTPPLQGLGTRMTLGQSGATLIWSAGLQYALTDRTQLGVAYQSASDYTLHGRINIDVPGLGNCGYDSAMNITWPQTLGIGVRHELCPHRTLAADVIWTGWSTAFDNFGFHLNNPTTPGFISFYEEFPLNWSDSISVRLGYERELSNGHIVRCGYVHTKNPIPNSTLTPFIQAIHEHAVSVGYGWTTKRNWQIDLSYMYCFSPTIHVGTSDIIGGDFDDSTHRAQAHLLGLSLIRQF